ncbi:MAG: ABC transporter permease, partial [Flavobacteriales bacterium]
MSFSYYIAKRYLFSKTGNNAINIITVIASFGVIVGSLALFVILSGFSGLRTFSYNLLDVSDPDIKITATKGKSFFVTEGVMENLHQNLSIKEISNIVEERVFLEYNDKTEIAYI